MTATAENILREIKALPPGDIREVWECLSPVVNPGTQPQNTESKTALEAARSLYGRLAGGDSLARLLQERAKDRSQEDEQLLRLSRKYA